MEHMMERTYTKLTQQKPKEIFIDLSDLYMFCPKKPASTILTRLLENYGVEVFVLLNFGDVFEIVKDYENIAYEIIRVNDDPFVAFAEISNALMRKLQKEITMVELYDGYEIAVAWVGK